MRTCLFANLEFRTTPNGRIPYLAGTRLAIHQVARLLQDFKGDVEKSARHLGIPAALIREAERYAQDYAQEVEQLIREGDRGFDALQRLLPNLEKV